jgi:acyl-CoA thioester hydrolase
MGGAVMKAYGYDFTVNGEDIDFNGHVGNVKYLEWMIEAAQKHSASLGAGYGKCMELGGTWVAKSHRIEYRRPAFEGETLHMKTWIEDIGRIASLRRYEISRGEKGEIVCEGATEWVFVDGAKMRPMKIPEEIKRIFQKEE